MNVTTIDVKRLMEEPSARVRGMLAGKIATDYREGRFNTSESGVADEIFRVLLKDIEKRVRQALAEQLAHAPRTPRDIILKLAQDEVDVAIPILEYSSVLSEDDLIAIVHSTGEVMKLRAIARRESVSEALAGCLIQLRSEPVMKDLFKNKGAAFSERQLLDSWDAIVTSPSLLELLVHRGGLPLVIAEKMLYAVSDELKRHLSSQYKLNTPFVHKAVSDVREWQMLGIVPSHSGLDPHDDVQVEELVEELHGNGRLTQSLLIRALCIGNLGIFEAGIARLSGVPRVNARLLLMDGGGLGFHAIYRASTMPEGFYEAIRTLLRLSLEETDYGRVRPADFRKRIIDRIYKDRYHRTIENMEYLLSIIGGKIAATADAH